MSNVGGNGTADGTPPGELVDGITKRWPWSEWSNAIAVSYEESAWDLDAEYDSTTPASPCGATIGFHNGVAVSAEHSVGPFQVNLCNYPADQWDTLRTLDGNLDAAFALWKERFWQPWYFSAQRLGLL